MCEVFEFKVVVRVRIKGDNKEQAKEHIINGFYDEWDLLGFIDEVGK